MSKYKEFIENNDLKIHSKQGMLVPYKLNPLQLMFDRDVIEAKKDRVIILKARQMGCSIFFLTAYLLDCLRQKSHVGIMAHKDIAARELIAKFRTLIINMEIIGYDVPLKKCNDHTIEFGNTGSVVNAVTANSPDLFRAKTLTHLHLSEFAFYNHPETMLSAAENAMAEGTKKVIETTANGFNYFKEFYDLQKVIRPQVWTPLFYAWYLMPEYQFRLAIEDETELNEEEISYTEAVKKETGFVLTFPQMMWRRNKIVSAFSTNPALFNQEYPYSERVAFLNSGGLIFGEIAVTYNENFRPLELFNAGIYILDGHPKLGHRYVLGADPSGGTGKDYSAIIGVDLETGEQVLQYNYNRLDPLLFAQLLTKLCKYFNDAYVVVESNSHGLSVLSYLKSNYNIGKIYKRSVETSNTRIDGIPVKYGWSTQDETLKLMIDTALDLLKSEIKIYSPTVITQLNQYSEDFGGKIIVGSKHQDLAIACMLACIGYKHYKKRIYEDEIKKTFDDIPKRKTFDFKTREAGSSFFDEDSEW
jgi:hypothetical protein